MAIWRQKYSKFGPYDCYIYDEKSNPVKKYVGIGTQKFGELQRIMNFAGLRGRRGLALDEQKLKDVVKLLEGEHES